MLTTKEVQKDGSSERMKIKKEVRELCANLINALHKDNTEEFKRIEKILKNQYGFTAWNLLALFSSPSTIEYTHENMNLIMEV